MPHGQGQQYVLDERQVLTDMLLSEKQLCSAYGVAELECTNPQLRSTLQQIAQEEGRFHEQLFQFMHQRGWYSTPYADAGLAQQISSIWSQKVQPANTYAATGRQFATSTPAPPQQHAGQPYQWQPSQPTHQQPYRQPALGQPAYQAQQTPPVVPGGGQAPTAPTGYGSQTQSAPGQTPGVQSPQQSSQFSPRQRAHFTAQPSPQPGSGQNPGQYDEGSASGQKPQTD